MKKSIISIVGICLLIFTLAIGLAACGKKCEHTYDNACDAICNQCEETREVGAHDFAAADCDTAKTCKNCGVTEGEALGHLADETADASKVTRYGASNLDSAEGSSRKLGAKTADEDACKVEHILSDETFEAIKQHMNRHIQG